MSGRGAWQLPLGALLAAAALAAGCAGWPPSGDRDETRSLTLTAPRHVLDDLAREPMVAQHPEGALFVAGYGSQVTGTDPESVPQLWNSDDGGASWARVDVRAAVGGATVEGAGGNSDVDLAIAPDGTLYFVAMGFDRSTGAGTHIAMGVSRDVGETWTWTRLSQDRFDDRPWVEVAPDGAAHVIWNDGKGPSHAVSLDRGETWQEGERIHPHGGSSHLAIGPGGEVAVRITPLSASGNAYDEGVELIAVSTDRGETWSKHPAPGNRVWDPTFRDPSKVSRWVEPIAWSGDGSLWHLWSEGTVMMLARSADLGATWSQWPISGTAISGTGATEDAEPEAIAYFPYLAAAPSGELAATWFTGTGEQLSVHLALIQPAAESGGEPRVVHASSFQPDSWQEGVDEAPPTRTPAGEYVPVIALANGDLAVVTPVQDAARDRWGFTWWTAERGH